MLVRRSIDVGTTSCRFYIFDHLGNVVAQHQLEYKQSTLPPPSLASLELR